MTSSTINLRLRTAVDRIRQAMPPLLLVVGLERPVSDALRTLAMDLAVPLVSLSRLFAERLAELSPRERERRSSRLFRELLKPPSGSFTMLDRTALLFLPTLMLNPLHLLTEASRTHGPIIAAWCGAWDGTVLTYARPGHPEYRRYAHPVATVVSL